MKRSILKYLYFGLIAISSLLILLKGIDREYRMSLATRGTSIIRIYNPNGKLVYKSQAKAPIQRNQDVLQYQDSKGVHHSVDYGNQDLVTVDSIHGEH